MAGFAYAFRMGFGERLQEAREAANLTGEELGRRLAVSKSTISHWENGRYEPGIGQLKALCAELSVTAAWLLEQEHHVLTAAAVREARAFQELSPENQRKWTAMRLTMFSLA